MIEPADRKQVFVLLGLSTRNNEYVRELEPNSRRLASPNTDLSDVTVKFHKFLTPWP